MSTLEDVIGDINPLLREIVLEAAQHRRRAIDGVLALLEQALSRREITPNECQVTVTYQTDIFVVLSYNGGFFTASFLYSESDLSRRILVLDAEHVAPLVTGVVVIPDQQFIQRGQS